MVRTCVPRFIVAVFGIPCSSMVTVSGWTLIMWNGPVTLDWSLLYPFFGTAAAMISRVARRSGLSKNM